MLSEFIVEPFSHILSAWDELESSRKRYISLAVADLDFGQEPDESASLGRFYLDLLAPGSHMDTRHPLFRASVKADGPTRVLTIMDSSLPTPHTLTDTVTHRFNYECLLNINVGVSIVDWKPQELMYISISDLSVRRHFSDQQDVLQFAIRRISADCSLWVTKYPSLLRIVKGTKSKNAIDISFCRVTNDALGSKDITLLRNASIEVGKLVFKIDGVLASSLLQMIKTSTKSLSYAAKEEENDPIFLKFKYPKTSSHTSQMETAANASKVQRGNELEIIPPSSREDGKATKGPKHKFYIERLAVSAIKAEISYCGSSPLPTWLSPAFMFEGLPFVFPSFSINHVYGSASEHMSNIVKSHYNIWSLLFGLSLRPTFIARAFLFTTKQSVIAVFEQASRALASISLQVNPPSNLQETSDVYSNQATYNVADVFLRGVRRMVHLMFTPFNWLYQESHTDVRVRAPRLFIKRDNEDVLVEYVEGESTGRALLSQVKMGIYLYEGYMSHGDLQGIGEYKIAAYDSIFSYILTTERLLIIKSSKTLGTPSVFWDVELPSIAFVDVDELPQDKLSLQFLYMERNKSGLSMLSSMLLLFNDSRSGMNVLKDIYSINKRLTKRSRCGRRRSLRGNKSAQVLR